MQCQYKGCKTILSEVANPHGEYCLKHYPIVLAEDDKIEEAKEWDERYKGGRQITDFIPIEESLEHAKANLKDKKIETVYRTNKRGKPEHAIVRYN